MANAPEQPLLPIEMEFAHLEAELKAHNPGVYDVMMAYAPYDAAAKIAEQYLSALTPTRPSFTTDNSTASR